MNREYHVAVDPDLKRRLWSVVCKFMLGKRRYLSLLQPDRPETLIYNLDRDININTASSLVLKYSFEIPVAQDIGYMWNKLSSS